MEKIKIFIHYNIIDEPWGGGNSFLKAFRNYVHEFRQDQFQIVNNIKNDFDIFFINGGHKDQGVYLNICEIKRARYSNFIDFLQRKKRNKIVYRLDGARYKYNKTKSKMDTLQYKVCNMADFIIFQSEECLESFKALGFEGSNYKIIYNGVNQELFNYQKKKFWDKTTKLKIFSSNWSSNINKGYETIANFSKSELVENYFVGNWNHDVNPMGVKINGPLKQEELANCYRSCDVFLHAAKDDPCPNVVLEAMSCGLPVIYHNSGGTKEIASKYGIKLPDKINVHTIDETIKNMTRDYDGLVKNIKADHDKFSIKNVAEKYLETFKEVMKG